MGLSIGDLECMEGMAASIRAGLFYRLGRQLGESVATSIKEAYADELDVTPEEIQAEIDDETDEALLEAEPMWECLSYGIAAGLVWYLRRDPPDDVLPAELRAELEKKNEGEHAETSSTSLDESPLFTWLADFARVFTEEWEPQPRDGGRELKRKLVDFLEEHPMQIELNTKGIVK